MQKEEKKIMIILLRKSVMLLHMVEYASNVHNIKMKALFARFHTSKISNIVTMIRSQILILKMTINKD